jgi:SAM-dependent methyltransferase
MKGNKSYKQKKFLKEFAKDDFLKFRTTYESINPDRPIETANARYEDTEPGFRDFLKQAGDTDQAFIEDILPHLGLFLQGPFPLPGNRISRSAWDCRGKMSAYKAIGIIPQIADARVLDVGCNAGYDTFLMSSLGAIEAVGIEPHGFYHHASFLDAVYQVPGVSFHKLGWEDLEPRFFRGFDVVSCQGLIYHLKNPALLLEKLAAIMRPGSTLLMETHVLLEQSSSARFIEGTFWGDETYWWIFGDQCLMGMLRTSGFRDVRMPLKVACDSRNPTDSKYTVEGHAAGARAWFLATRA